MSAIDVVRPWDARVPRRLAVPALTGIGTALPRVRTQAELWDGFFRDHYGDHRLARRLWANAGVDTRHGVADPLEVDVRQWSTARRMEAFAEYGMPLGREAVEACLADAELDPADVGLLCVVTCTGYGTPGIDIRLADELGLPATVQRLHIGHMGCYAAVPGLSTVADAAAARGKAAIMLCLELTSLHLQPPDERLDVQQLISHALFSDGAAAAAVVPDAGGFEVVDVVALTDIATSHMMSWEVTDLGFRMGLSHRVPKMLERHVEPAMEQLLRPHGLGVEDVAGWAVHPGGPKILDAVEESLGLPEEALACSRAVLRDHGNLSSATVLLVLDELRRSRDFAEGEPIVFMAFGPGLTLYAALLRATG
jgi:predicted naringenin-chalcone synthase